MSVIALPQQPTFALTLDDIRELAIAVGALDFVKPRGCKESAEIVEKCHAILERSLGDQAELVYGAPEAETCAA